jgi:hypothetical protein
MITVMKSIKVEWVGHVARMGEARNAYRMLVGEAKGKMALVDGG